MSGSSVHMSSGQNAAALRSMLSSSSGSKGPPPPGLGLQFDNSARRDYVLGSLFSGESEQAPAPTEVKVKNTFIHVEDVAQPLMRSRSTSDLSSVSSSQSDSQRRLNHESFVSSDSQRRLNHEGFDRTSSTSFDRTPGFDRPQSSGFDRAPGADRPTPSPPPQRVNLNRFDPAPGADRLPPPQRVIPGACNFVRAPGADRSSPPMRVNLDNFNRAPGAYRPAQPFQVNQDGFSNALGADRPAFVNHAGFDLAPAADSLTRPLRVFPEGFDRTPGGASSSSSQAPPISLSVAHIDPPRVDAEHAGPDLFAEDDTQDQEEEGEWSLGSAKHESGECKPCLYYRSKKGCTSGRDCSFCHMPHTRKVRARPCKAKRAQCKQIVAMLETVHGGNPERMADDLCRRSAETGASATEQSYLLSILASKARLQEERREQFEVPAGGAAQNDARQRSGQPHSAQQWKLTL